MMDEKIDEILKRFDDAYGGDLDDTIYMWEETLRPILEELWMDGWNKREAASFKPIHPFPNRGN